MPGYGGEWTAGIGSQAIRKDGGKFNTNPAGQDRVSADDTLIFLGTPEQIRNMERLMEE